ncbi:GTPase [Coprinopsis cinerea okayama7|uniref:GTPase n=1 Tax=Coprinopsis cinerea (strain Okayama-7 / 130 / ATCC MYA-4618 / FGSC 9003) TaxID=240176 RepID=A8P292_COPC7|nr:GTPase [Coprinopsis cinerea okayama7\|eukprot:XP_001838264.2 GTPase [Coprinopsis cinerea okayama7\
MGRTKNRKGNVPVKSMKVKNQQKKPDVPLERRFDSDAHMASEPTLSTLAQLAAEASSNVQEEPSSSTSTREKTKEQLRRYYVKSLHKVIDESDIILLVLDARDPEGCRSRLVEEEVRRRESEGKKLVFVLNKIAYKPKTRSVTVGVVGYPNVGKSSLINSLKRSKPGHTKDLQSIQLERGLRVIDSPGVVFDDDAFDDGKGTKKGSILLRNVVKVEDVEDPIAVVEEILLRTPRETIQKIYNLPEFGTPLEFLTMLALSSGRLHKGGTPDLNSAARQVLTDWNQQKIPYFSQPPEIHPSLIPSTVHGASTAEGPVIAPGAEQVGQAQILETFSKPFELDGLFTAADAGAFNPGSTNDVQMDADMDPGEGEVFVDAPEEMDQDGTGMDAEELPPFKGPRKRTRSPSPPPANAAVTMFDDDSRPSYHYRQPKRVRRNKDIPEYHAKPDDHVLQRMGKSNPLNRKALKLEKKKARKQMKLQAQAEAGESGGMQVDNEDLSFTFMA